MSRTKPRSERGAASSFRQDLLGRPADAIQLAHMLENLPYAIIGQTLDGTVTIWNKAAEELYGYRSTEALGRSAGALIPPELLQEFYERREQVKDGERLVEWETVRTRKDGSTLEVNAALSPILGEGGRIVGVSEVTRDITARKRLEREVHETEGRFRVMADCSPVYLWMSGTDARCDFFNQTWLTFTGRSLEEELGDGWAEGVHHEDLQGCLDTYMEAFNARREFVMEYRLRRADGEYRWILDHGAPRYAPDGRFAGFIGSCVDITDIREARETLRRSRREMERLVHQRTEELRSATEELLRSNAELENFASLASHDLQEPLRKMISYCDLLQKWHKESLSEEARHFLDVIAGSSSRMSALIRDLLDYARLGHDKRPSQAADSAAALAQALANLELSIAQSGAAVDAQALPPVLADASALTRLFQNLIGNAVKFRAQSAPLIQVGARRRGPLWEFSVRDNGIGIDPQYHPKIFQLFSRLHPKHQYPGTGIGLAACKKIVERYGGRLWVESQAGKGATFFFTLPAA